MFYILQRINYTMQYSTFGERNKILNMIKKLLEINYELNNTS